jgi:hypothetical protein
VLVVYGAAVDRMSREQFFGATAGLDSVRLRELLWNVYWRGPAAVRARVEAELSPAGPASRPGLVEVVDPAEVLAAVREFASLVRSGAYFAGDRRVSPKRRTRWRFVFKELIEQARQALRAEQARDADDRAGESASGGGSSAAGAAAVEMLIDLACALRDSDYVRSEDPIAAAGVVVSDEVALLWRWLLERDGVDRFARVAMAQLVRWESRYGWTRSGDGAVARRETTLAQVMADLVRVPDAWEVVAAEYLVALDADLVAREGPGSGRRYQSGEERARTLAGWHEVLLDRLSDGAAEGLLDQVAEHPSLAGPERDFFAARLAHRRGDTDTARRLVSGCLAALPGHQEFRRLADQLGVAPGRLEPSAVGRSAG